MTIRETVIDAINDGDYVVDALRKAHEANYERLDCHRDGSLNWQEDVTRDTRTIDDEADGFDAIPTLALVGVGSIHCNCDWCSGDNAVDSSADIDFESDELSAMQDSMLAEIELIPIGYFDDETIEEAE